VKSSGGSSEERGKGREKREMRRLHAKEEGKKNDGESRGAFSIYLL
jgi:hypothetical protein